MSMKALRSKPLSPDLENPLPNHFVHHCQHCSTITSATSNSSPPLSSARDTAPRHHRPPCRTRRLHQSATRTRQRRKSLPRRFLR
ncbi:unnamed protein product [Linum trigynum]|uniref:Uncharacterized protein n=1 Tax=Linum trigynum TaxID=586398 RepID=A0AAV2GPA9_9ROSI